MPACMLLIPLGIGAKSLADFFPLSRKGLQEYMKVPKQNRLVVHKKPKLFFAGSREGLGFVLHLCLVLASKH